MRAPLLLPATAAALLTAIALPAPTRACTCAAQTIQVLPGSDVAAPTNTHVWVLIPDYEEWRDGVGAKDAEVNVGLRRRTGSEPAPKGKKGKKGKQAPAEPRTVEVDRSDVASGKWRMVQLAPKGELDAKTRYQVIMWIGAGKQEVVGEFTTGGGPDTVAPTFAGVKKASMQRDGEAAKCGSGLALARLILGDVADEGGAGKDALIYGLWTAGSDGKVAYDQPPATYLFARGGKLVVGKASMCTIENYVFPKDVKSLIVGVRAIDLAGNKADTAGEVVLDLSKVVESSSD
jgi:hypothetical protein